MNLNLSKFKKVFENKHSATLKHPDGHDIKIAKTGLNEKSLKELAALPMHMAEGGMSQAQTPEELAEEYQAQSFPASMVPEQATPPTFEQEVDERLKRIAPNLGSSPVEGQLSEDVLRGRIENQLVNEKYSSAKQQEKKDVQTQDKQLEMYQHDYEYVKNQNEKRMAIGLSPLPLPQPPQSPQGLQVASTEVDMGLPSQQPQMEMPQAPSLMGTSNDYYGEMDQALQQKKQGVLQEAAAQSELAQAQAPLYAQAAHGIEDIQKDYQARSDALLNERNSFIQDVKSNMIDPQRYLNSMSTGSKIATAIGMVLGGAGAGLAGGENPVLSYLNNQIDRDIQGQMKNMESRQSLVQANHQGFQDMQSAMQATKLNMLDLTKLKIEEAVAKSNDPITQARAKQLVSDISMQQAQLHQQLAMRQMVMGGGGGVAQNPATKLRLMSMMGMIPDSQLSAAQKELGDAQELTKSRDKALGVFDKVAKMNTASYRAQNPIQAGSQIEALTNPLLMELAKDAAGKFSEMEFHALKPMMPELKDNEKTLDIKRRNLNAFIQKKMNFPTLSTYGINPAGPAGAGRYDDSGQKKIQLGAPVVADRQR